MSDTQDHKEPESIDDLWGAAMRENQEAHATAEGESTDTQLFKPMSEPEGEVLSARDIEMIRNVPVELTVELGRTRLSIGKLLELVQGSVIELESLIGEPMDVKINGHIIAKCEVMDSDSRFAIRIASIVTPSERAERFSGIN